MCIKVETQTSKLEHFSTLECHKYMVFEMRRKTCIFPHENNTCQICITLHINPRLQYPCKCQRSDDWYWSRVVYELWYIFCHELFSMYQTSKINKILNLWFIYKPYVIIQRLLRYLNMYVVTFIYLIKAESIRKVFFNKGK